MSGHIFPVQLAALHQALEGTQVIESLAHETAHYGLLHEDDKTRMVLRSPAVMQAVGKRFGVRDCRVRIAFPADTSFLSLVDHTVLEVYAVDKRPLTAPLLLVALEDDLSCPVQVELLQLLLRAKGIDIPML